MKKRALLLVSSCALTLAAAMPAHAEKVPFPYLPDSYDGPTTVVSGPVGDSIPGEIVVDLKDDISDEQIQALADEFHISLRDNSPDIKDDGKIDIADVDPSEVDSLVERLSHDPRVEAAEPMEIARAF